MLKCLTMPQTVNGKDDYLYQYNTESVMHRNWLLSIRLWYLHYISTGDTCTTDASECSVSTIQRYLPAQLTRQDLCGHVALKIHQCSCQPSWKWNSYVPVSLIKGKPSLFNAQGIICWEFKPVQASIVLNHIYNQLNKPHRCITCECALPIKHSEIQVLTHKSWFIHFICSIPLASRYKT